MKPSPDAKSYTILDDISGSVKPGQFMAIIGASGAGKTTLLNFLAGRDPSRGLEKSGEVLINGVDKNSLNFKKYVAYVQQDDVLMQSLTVRECITFAGRMRLPTSANIKNRVDMLLENLKLSNAANTKIGGSFSKGVSGGERKRCSIAVELITDPNMIVLDEPTTGLDSYTASVIVNVLRELALTGRTVIATIHQPNSETFELFDQLMLLALGKIIYMNEARRAVKYFESIGFPCPNQTNPADFFMNLMSIEAYDDHDHSDHKVLKRSWTLLEETYREKIIFLNKKYEESELYCTSDDSNLQILGIDDTYEFKYHAGVFFQLYLLFMRSITCNLRVPLTSYVKIFTYVAASLIAVLTYNQLERDAQSIQSRNGLLFFVMALYSILGFQSLFLIFPDEKPVFIREQGENLYSWTAYIFSKLLSELPIMIINVNLVCAIIYYPVELNSNGASHFFIFYGYSYLISMTTICIGLFGGCLVPDKETANSLNAITVLSLILLWGIFRKQSDMVVVLIPFKYLSAYKWGFQVFTLNEYDGLTLSCSPACDPIKSLNFDEDLNESIWATAVLGLGFFLLAYMVLMVKAYQAQR